MIFLCISHWVFNSYCLFLYLHFETYNLGGNVTSGDQGNDFSYSEFAALFGIGLSDLSGVETSSEGYYI